MVLISAAEMSACKLTTFGHDLSQIFSCRDFYLFALVVERKVFSKVNFCQKIVMKVSESEVTFKLITLNWLAFESLSKSRSQSIGYLYPRRILSAKEKKVWRNAL